MNWENLRTGTIACEPNMSQPLPSRLKPGWECALHKYPSGGQVWLFMRPVGEATWDPVREATESDVNAFRKRGKLLHPRP